MSPSPLAPLLEAQALDLAASAATKRSAELPERALLPDLSKKMKELEALLATARAERAQLETAEHDLATAVSQIVRDIEAADVERYSGKHKTRDDAHSHTDAQEARRKQQSTLEEEELALLESIETTEALIANAESQIEKQRIEGTRVTQAIQKAEAEVGAELARLANDRAGLIASLPEKIVAAYDRVRAGKASGGRGATVLEKGSCTGCRISLPSLEKRRMLEEPADALLQCPQCRRVLVRS